MFGSFNDPDGDFMDRFYYIGDWEDEYCDLTLDKLVTEMKEKADTSILRTIKTPEDIHELKQQLTQLEDTKDQNKFKQQPDPPVKENIFKRVTTFFKKDKNK